MVLGGQNIFMSLLHALEHSKKLNILFRSDLIIFLVSLATFLMVEMRFQNSDIKLDPKKGMIRDIIWQHYQEPWNPVQTRV